MANAIATVAVLAVLISSAAAINKPTNSLLAPLGNSRPSSAAAAAAAAVAPTSFSSDSIRSFEQETPSADGAYKYAFETDAVMLNAGTKVEEQAVQKIVDGDVPALAVAGSYSYSAPDGQLVSVTYVADENGFQPQGDHLPVPPAIPEAIQRALRYIQSHPAAAQ